MVGILTKVNNLDVHQVKKLIKIHNVMLCKMSYLGFQKDFHNFVKNKMVTMNLLNVNNQIGH